MKVIVDAFGGDNAPQEIIKGAKLAADELGYDIVLVGDEEKIKGEAIKNNVSIENMQIVHAPDVISMEDAPTDILKSKNNSSMAVGLRLLAQGEGDAFVSAGNSGALCVGATLIVKRIKGVKRCAFAPVIPKSNGFFMLIDSGANVECRPEMLKQFGIMGSIYMKNVMTVANPRVGLVNVGTESTKGDELRFEAFNLLKDSNINFIGNIEAREIPADCADVVVADGFTGNIILKFYEGMAKEMFSKFKNIFVKSFKNKLASAVLMPDIQEMKKHIDYKEYGGAPLIGISKSVFKAHGNSDAKTFKNAIRLAGEYTKRNIVKLISESIKENEVNKEENAEEK
ncbi:MAG: phosphate acyltransferase PlsX [Clostridia bacterium]|nr:phosphate acyltransferase PlsX [Clostridia bacterium]